MNLQWCDRCQQDTRWERLPRSKRERCTVCKNMFPCKPTCTHLDCQAARGETVRDHYGNPYPMEKTDAQ